MKLARLTAKANIKIYGKKSPFGKTSKTFLKGTTPQGIVKPSFRQKLKKPSKYWK